MRTKKYIIDILAIRTGACLDWWNSKALISLILLNCIAWTSGAWSLKERKKLIFSIRKSSSRTSQSNANPTWQPHM